MKNKIKSYWTFGDDGWRIESRPTNENKSHLILYADNELVFEGTYGSLIKLIKKNKTRQKYKGEIHTIASSELVKDADLLNKMLALVTRVYDAEDAELFRKEIVEAPDIIVTYMMIGDDVIGLGCITESHISYGIYELFWGMLDEQYRGNGWGKVLVESRIEWVAKHNKGLSYPNDIIVVTKSPWHLTRCGFEIIKYLNDDGEVLMYRKVDSNTQV